MVAVDKHYPAFVVVAGDVYQYFVLDIAHFRLESKSQLRTHTTPTNESSRRANLAVPNFKVLITRYCYISAMCKFLNFRLAALHFDVELT